MNDYLEKAAQGVAQVVDTFAGVDGLRCVAHGPDTANPVREQRSAGASDRSPAGSVIMERGSAASSAEQATASARVFFIGGRGSKAKNPWAKDVGRAQWTSAPPSEDRSRVRSGEDVTVPKETPDALDDDEAPSTPGDVTASSGDASPAQERSAVKEDGNAAKGAGVRRKTHNEGEVRGDRAEAAPGCEGEVQPRESLAQQPVGRETVLAATPVDIRQLARETACVNAATRRSAVWHRDFAGSWGSAISTVLFCGDCVCCSWIPGFRYTKLMEVHGCLFLRNCRPGDCPCQGDSIVSLCEICVAELFPIRG